MNERAIADRIADGFIRSSSRTAAVVPSRAIQQGMEEADIPPRAISKIEVLAKRYYEIISLLKGRPRVKAWVSRKTGAVIGYRIGNEAYAGWVKGVGVSANYSDYFGHYHEYAYCRARGQRYPKPAGYADWAEKNPDVWEKLQ